MARMLRTAPGRSSASSVRSSGRSAAYALAYTEPRDQRDRGVDDEQPLPADVGQGGATEQRAEDEAGHADDDHQRHGAHAQRLLVEQPEDQRVGDRRHRGGGKAEGRTQRDQLTSAGDEDDAEAEQAEDGETDQQHAPAPQPVGHRAGGEQQSTEGQRIGAGDPLKGGRAAAEVAADGRQRDRQEGVVDHLDEERQAEGGERESRRRAGRCRCGVREIVVVRHVDNSEPRHLQATVIALPRLSAADRSEDSAGAGRTSSGSHRLRERLRRSGRAPGTG